MCFHARPCVLMRFACHDNKLGSVDLSALHALSTGRSKKDGERAHCGDHIALHRKGRRFKFTQSLPDIRQLECFKRGAQLSLSKNPVSTTGVSMRTGAIPFAVHGPFLSGPGWQAEVVVSLQWAAANRSSAQHAA